MNMQDKKRCAAIVLAAGKGKRMGTAVAKDRKSTRLNSSH